MMMFDEAYVRKEKLQQGYIGPITDEILDRFFYDGVDAISEIDLKK